MQKSRFQKICRLGFSSDSGSLVLELCSALKIMPHGVQPKVIFVVINPPHACKLFDKGPLVKVQYPKNISNLMLWFRFKHKVLF